MTSVVSKTRNLIVRLPLKMFGAVFFTVLLSYYAGRQVAFRGESGFIQFVALIAGGALGLAILIRPHLGVIALLAILPINLVLGQLPFGQILAPFLGALTVGSYLLHYRWEQEKPDVVPLQWIHLVVMVFVGWIFVSSPHAAILGGDRNWLFTFAQLGALLYLSGALLRSPRRQNEALLAFTIAAVVSAIVAISDNASLFGGSVGFRELRGGGLAGINTGARYFLVAVIAIIYLRGQTPRRLLRLLGLAAIVVLLFGVIVTGSRTGLLLLPIVLGFALARRDSRGSLAPFALMIIVALALLFILPSDFRTGLMESLFPLEAEAGENEDVRIILWGAALQMWQDHPFFGVGVGQFSTYLPRYAATLLPPDRLDSGSHSIYLGLLAETGVFGLLLFSSVWIASLIAFWRVFKMRIVDHSALAFTWLAILLLLLIGGFTKHDQYDKLLWFVFGMGALYAYLWRSKFGQAIAEENRSISATGTEPG